MASHAINCTTGSPASMQSIASAPMQSSAEPLPQPEVRYLQASLSEATKRAYRADVLAFLSWGGSIPATQMQVARYLAALAEELSPVTLQRRAVAIGKAHVVQGYADPTKDEHVRATLRGIRRLHGRPQRQAAPLLREDLLAVVDALPDSLMGVRDRALLLVGFAGGFRRSEVVGLDVEDVAFVPDGLLVTLRRSKTDQEGAGRKVGIPYGRTRACPVKALRTWLDKAEVASGPIFRPVGKGGKIGSRALTDQSVNLVLRKCAARVGLSCERLTGHSLRAGLVTSAAKAGISSWKIRQQTGHRSDAMLQRYIRDADIFVGNAAGALL
jgi:integrase